MRTRPSASPDSVLAAPEPDHGLEFRPVLEAGLGATVVLGRHRHRLAHPRAHVVERLAGGERLTGGDRARRRVPHPDRSGVVLGGRRRLAVDLEFRAAGAVGTGDDLERAALSVGQHQRPLEGDILERARRHARCRTERARRGRPGHFQKACPRKHDGAVNTVIAEPAVGARLGCVQLRVHRRGDAEAEQRMPRLLGAPGHRVGGLPGQPVSPSLERIRGERRAPAGRVAIEGGPVHRGAGRVDLGGGLEDLDPVGLPAPQRRHERMTGPGEAAHHAEQDRMRSDLDEQVRPVLLDGADPVPEADRLAYVTGPVLGVEHLAVYERRAGHVRDQREPGRSCAHPRGRGPERLEHRLHERRVEGVRHDQPVAADAARGQRCLGRGELARVPREHRQLRSVHRGQRQTGMAGDGRARGLLVGHHRAHGAARRQRLHQTRAGGDQSKPFLELHGAGDARGHVLAHAVAEDRARLDAPRAPHGGERPLEGEQRRLGVLGLVDRRGLPPGRKQDLEQRARQLAVEDRGAAVELAAEDRLAVVELAAHAGCLRALAGEQEGDRQRPGPLAAGRREDTRSGRRAQAPRHLLASRRDDGKAMLEVSPAGARREADIGERDRRSGAKVRRGARRRSGQRGRAARREAEKMRIVFRRRRDRPRQPDDRIRRLLEEHVRVGPAERERAHSGDAAAAGWTPPRHALGRHGQAAAVELHVRVEAGELPVGRDLGGLQGKDRLDQGDHAGPVLQVAHAGLGAAEVDRVPPRPARAEDPGQRPDLDRVAERRAGAVRLHVAHVARVDPGAGQDGADERLLCLRARCGEPGRAAIVIEAGAAHDGEDRVAGSQRLVQAAQDQHAAALGARVSIGGCVEHLAAAVRRQRAGFREHDVLGRRQDRVGPAGQRQLALAAQEAHAGLVQRDQRRRAGGRHHRDRSVEVERARDPAARHRQRAAGRAAVAEPAGVGEQVLVEPDPHEHAGGAAVEPARRQPGALERLP